jgi:hypothetical protein
MFFSDHLICVAKKGTCLIIMYLLTGLRDSRCREDAEVKPYSRWTSRELMKKLSIFHRVNRRGFITGKDPASLNID